MSDFASQFVRQAPRIAFAFCAIICALNAAICLVAREPSDWVFGSFICTIVFGLLTVLTSILAEANP